MVSHRNGSTDPELIKRIASGDRGAVQALFARHYTRVYRFLVRQLGSDTMAEDIANEVFLDVWRQAKRFEGRSAVSTWLMAIARNKAISFLRKRREDALNEDYAATIADEGDTPDVTAQKTDKAALIRRAIDNLSADHKAVIDLVYYHEMSIAEVSEVLSIAEGTVKTRVFHARKNLAESLVAAGVDRGWP